MKLEQASGANQLTMKKLALRTDTCLNKREFKKIDLYYVQNFQSDTVYKMGKGEKIVSSKGK